MIEEKTTVDNRAVSDWKKKKRKEKTFGYQATPWILRSPDDGLKFSAYEIYIIHSLSLPPAKQLCQT